MILARKQTAQVKVQPQIDHLFCIWNKDLNWSHNSNFQAIQAGNPYKRPPTIQIWKNFNGAVERMLDCHCHQADRCHIHLHDLWPLPPEHLQVPGVACFPVEWSGWRHSLRCCLKLLMHLMELEQQSESVDVVSHILQEQLHLLGIQSGHSGKPERCIILKVNLTLDQKIKPRFQSPMKLLTWMQIWEGSMMMLVISLVAVIYASMIVQ